MKVLDKLTDEKELLLRQVNPGLLRAGRPSSAVFEPKKNDAGLLSIGQEKLRKAEEAYAFFVKLPRCKSLGLLAVTVAECANAELPAHHAPLFKSEGDPWDDEAHGIIDFTVVTKEAVEEKAKEVVEEKAVVLHRAAMDRGYVYRPAEETKK